MEKPMTINTKYLYLALLAAALLLPASAFAQRETTNQFIISKTWDQGGDTDGLQVTGHLSCTGATTTQQNVVFTATTDAILFVYDIGLAQGQVDCTITEDVPTNYRARYDCSREGPCFDSDQGEAKCFFPNVQAFETVVCHITNRPLPAVVTVTKTWVVEGADQGFDGGHWISGSCDSKIIAADSVGRCGPGCFYAEYREEDAVEGSLDYEFTVTKPNYPFSRCAFGEFADDSVVESDNGCGRINLGAGAVAECEIVNTVFFEGIPTLSRYGMAVMALLMLGVGLIGFRRFV
jgi:hypothetical protein